MSEFEFLRFLGVNSLNEAIWIGVGLAGQLLFFTRFLIQWIVSEREKRSVIPVSFWWFSIAGAGVLLSYAIYREDPVFILGQSTGFFIYGRNILLIRKAALRGDGDAGRSSVNTRRR